MANSELGLTFERAHELAVRVGGLLREQGLTVAAAESCTGGLLGHLITSVPGASEYFLASLVTYSDEMKQALLGVRAETLAKLGAVSEQTALEMALGVRERTGADLSVSITGIAGPAGGSAEKPVGTVCFALASVGENASFHCVQPAPRDEFQRYCAFVALSLFRQKLCGEALRISPLESL